VTHSQVVPPRAATVSVDRLRALNGELERQGLEAELTLVGAAIMPIVFVKAPGTRRPAAMFAKIDAFRTALDRVEAPSGWQREAVREVVEGAPGGIGTLDLGSLRVYPARPDHVLAMKCAALSYESGDGVSTLVNDIRFLLRLLDVRSADEAIGLVTPFFTLRQLPADLPDLLARLIA
jgi:hypothetical protein